MMCSALKVYVSVTLSFVNEVTAHPSCPEGTLFLIDVDVLSKNSRRSGKVRDSREIKRGPMPSIMIRPCVDIWSQRVAM